SVIRNVRNDWRGPTTRSPPRGESLPRQGRRLFLPEQPAAPFEMLRIADLVGLPAGIQIDDGNEAGAGRGHKRAAIAGQIQGTDGRADEMLPTGFAFAAHRA